LPTICTERGSISSVVLSALATLARVAQARIGMHHLAHQQAGAEARAQASEGQVRDARHGRQGHGVGRCV
jgi:hypothetical protein